MMNHKEQFQLDMRNLPAHQKMGRNTEKEIIHKTKTNRRKLATLCQTPLNLLFVYVVVYVYYVV
jgi:hypothetical protein